MGIKKVVLLFMVLIFTTIQSVPMYGMSDANDETVNGTELDTVIEDPEDGAYVDSDGYISTEWYYFSPDEIEILAQVMLHEAGSQCEAGKIAVVEVILNRLQSHHFSQDTVEEVVYAPGQFSDVDDSLEIVPSDKDLCLVQDVILGNKRVLDDKDILYFRNTMIIDGLPTSKAVDWNDHRYAVYIQDHAFYYQ